MGSRKKVECKIMEIRNRENTEFKTIKIAFIKYIFLQNAYLEIDN